MHRDHARLTEIYCKARGQGKFVKNTPKTGSGSGRSLAKDQGVINILEDRTGDICGDGMGQRAVLPGKPNHALEHVGDDDKEIR
jgi:hypothetical protein